jgi:uncharacterized delta-60 repeat protein
MLLNDLRQWRALAFTLLMPVLATAQSGSVDPSFNVGTGANNRIFAMAAQPDGRQIIGGTFTNYAGNAVNRLARITRTGGFDNTFSIGTGPNGQVNAVAVDGQGRILIGGSFSMYNGVQRARLARLNANGTLDATFDIGTGMGGGVVTAIAIQADGKIIAVGAFNTFNGVAQNRVVRLNADGTRDASFNIGSGPNGDVYTMSIDQDGRVVIGGAFGTVNGIARSGIARLTTTGAVDTSFNPGGGFNGLVYAVAHQRDGGILVGGTFTSYNGSIPAARIARLQRNGTYDATFVTGTGFNSWVYTITVQGDGKILAGGDFTSYNGATRNRLVRLNTNGSHDGSFNTGTTCNNWVYAITWQPEGRVTAAGGFTSFNGSARNRIIRLNSVCDESLALTLRTDAFGAQTSWELLGEGFTYPICSGSGLASSTETTVSCCVPYGPLRLRVLDSAGDGMTSGGYVLHDASGRRIIDNRDDGVFGSESSIAANGSFYVPMGAGKPIFTACDKLDWVSSQYMVASALPEVSAQWGVGDQTDDGYEFWWYDPDGSYSQRKFRSHATSDGFGSGALRACHQRLSWFPATNPIPEGVLLNVKVRGRVNGVNMEWGTACRFKLDPVAAACPQTRLINIPGHQYFSCGVTKPRNKFVTAMAIPQANKYEFEFTNASLGYSHTIQSNNYHRYLNWTTNPLVAGQTYNVRVRASRDGGASFCPWGDVCTVTIAAAAQGGASSMIVQEDDVDVTLWPNPSTGDQVALSVSGLEGASTDVELTVIDGMGRMVHQRIISTEGPQWQGEWQFPSTLPTGQYFLRYRIGDAVKTERFVVTR